MKRLTATLFPFALLASLLLFAGCGKGSRATAPAGNGTPDDFNSLLKQSYVPGTMIPTTLNPAAHVLATLEVGDVRAAFAFFQQAGVFVDAGRVQLGRQRPIAWTGPDTLVRQSVPVNGTPFYAYSTIPALPDMPSLVFDGSRYHLFRVTGSADVAAFDDSVQSVSRPTVTAPAAAATVLLTDSLVVTWSDAGSDTTVYVLCGLRSQVDSTKAVTARLVRDADGRTSFTSARLGTLAAGPATLAVARFRLVHDIVGGDAVDILCEATEVRSVTLQ